ncbi:AMP-dependent synthetase/ligase in alkane synthesis cluster [hydrothermal vent metagenome]|uniref:AMP-dependent synthetase/ligase in alkane synthesis cluster n=1 Tax=hydrothermal vent metagenome TaxID=652676 RepID=A0A3B0UQF7_9ZZZZ
MPQADCNIAQALRRAAAARPADTALIAPGPRGGKSWTFAELDNNTGFYLDFLKRQGIRRGDRVMLMVRPSMAFIGLTFALFALGAVVILIDPGMGYKNLLRCIGSVAPEVFIGIPRAHIFKRLFPGPFRRVRCNICVGRGLGLLGRQLPSPDQARYDYTVVPTRAADQAAIIFTTGSTGPPKGVVYEHRVFKAQLARIRKYYGIQPADIDQPAFPLFALFSIALGACAVIPALDPSRPARVRPDKFIKTILEHKVTYSFGSPAIWRVIADFCAANNIKLLSLKKILMAGAPVSGELIERMLAALPADGDIHIPYGATEALPIISISGREVVSQTWPLTKQGRGVCVGRPLPDTEVRIMRVTAGPVSDLSGLLLPRGEVGEIIVKGEVVTRSYFNNAAETTLAKIRTADGLWHRMGDTGYFDEQGRLWFCGRKAHRVISGGTIYYPICCEAVFNQHPEVYRSALVGVGEAGRQRPVIIVEPRGRVDKLKLFAELRPLALAHEHTREIKDFLIHPSFPVDIRHNAKIFREKLALWAEDMI